MVGVRERAVALAQTPWPLVAAWLIGGAITAITPAIKWKKDRDIFYDYQGRYIEYEQNQRAYEQAQNGNNNNNNQYYMYQCKWFQYKCRINQYYYRQANGGNNNNRNNMVLPTWYAALGGKYEEERRDREDMGQSADSAPVKFVYVATLMMFLGILVYGAFVFSKRRSPATLIATMSIFGFAALMQLLLIPQGVIPTDNRELENSVYGWYGQLPVLMVYTDYAYFLFCIIAGPVIGLFYFVQAKFFGDSADGADAKPTSSAKLTLEDLSAKFTSHDDFAKEPLEESYKSMA